MNYFAHGRDALADPYRLVGTAVPDLLNVVNRRCRMRSRRAVPLLADADPRVAAVAAGVLDHLRDDAWFHETRAFAELSMTFCRQLRHRLGDDEGFRPHFVGHILVEILLDAVLIEAFPERLHAYYVAMESLDGQLIEATVNRMAVVPAPGLAGFLPLFCRERFLWDYGDDGKLLMRLNQVMRRVSLPALPEVLSPWLSEARTAVAARQDELLQSSRHTPCAATAGKTG
jgi:hypothetical protein